MSKINYQPNNEARQAEWSNLHQGRLLLRALESEIQLLRYWMLQSLQNYRAWRRMAGAAQNADYASQTRNDVKSLIIRAKSEYRRKQQIHRDLCLEYPYLSPQDIVNYQSINRYGDVMDNIVTD